MKHTKSNAQNGQHSQQLDSAQSKPWQDVEELQETIQGPIPQLMQGAGAFF